MYWAYFIILKVEKIPSKVSDRLLTIQNILEVLVFGDSRVNRERFSQLGVNLERPFCITNPHEYSTGQFLEFRWFPVDLL